MTDTNKRYLIARKLRYLYSGDVWFRVNIGICYSCNQLVYSKLRSGYEYFHAFFMNKHWRTNCTRNEYCDMSFEDYMKLKNNPPPCYFTKKAIRQYEMWLENVSNRIRHIRQKHKMQSNRYYSYRTDKSRSLTPPPLPPKPIALMGGLERYPMRHNASAPEISVYRFERSCILIDAEEYFNS
ncbi:954_t:CDS:2, partial [Funneliformis caledonium]